MKEKRVFKNFQELYRSMKAKPVEPHRAKPKTAVEEPKRKKAEKREDVQAD